MTKNTPRKVARRRVFYIPGFDPFPPRRYRELYRREARAQSEICGYDVAVHGGRSGTWRTEARIDKATTHSDFNVLIWSDIVRDGMGRSILQTYGQLVRTVWTYLATGTFPQLIRLRKGPAIAALYPVVMLLLQAACAVVLARLVAVAIHPIMAQVLGARAGTALSIVAAIGVAALVLHQFRRWDGRVFAYYLMHDYAFASQHRGADPPALSERLDQFADQVADALNEDVDEVLLVGHSSGAQLAVSVAARLIEGGALAGKPPLALLTLGQVVPMVSFLPDATVLRRDLSRVSSCRNLFWLDVSAPGDGCAFALCDPVAVSGVKKADSRWPLIISAAFSQTLSPDRWAHLRWRFFRLHFQYLCAFDRPGPYDYFRITAGPDRLSDAFAEKTPSRSRISAPVSRHRTVAA